MQDKQDVQEEPKEQQPKREQTPFFVRFLEQQESLVVQSGVKAGRTLKYPSDSDERDW